MLQSDMAVMIDTSMFEQFVLPDIKKCCDHLDHAFYHLDGKEQIQHLEFLAIKTLKHNIYNKINIYLYTESFFFK
jgi:hypothetical protein